MKQRFRAMAGRWVFVSALAAAAAVANAPVALAQGVGTTTTSVASAATPTTSLTCDGTLTKAADAYGDPQSVCVMPQPQSVDGTVPAATSSSTSSSDHDTTYGILIGATLVIAGSATSLAARRRKLVLTKPFPRRSV